MNKSLRPPLAFAFISIFLTIFFSSTSGANAPSAVRLTLENCNTVSLSETERILEIELESIMSEQDTVRPTHVNIVCDDTAFQVVVEDAASGDTAQRRVLLEDALGEGLERVMAIAATELVHSTWERFRNQENDVSEIPIFVTGVPMPGAHLENDTQSTPDATTAPPADVEPPNKFSEVKPKLSPQLEEDVSPTAPAKKRPQPKASRTLGPALQLSALWRMYIDTKTNLFGGELTGHTKKIGPFQFNLSLAAAGGLENRSVGQVVLFTTSGMPGVSVYRAVFHSNMVGRIRLGFRAGYGRMEGRAYGTAIDGHTYQGVVGGPVLKLSLHSTNSPAIGVSTEFGYAVFGIYGRIHQAPSVTLAGSWFSVMVDVLFFK